MPQVLENLNGYSFTLDESGAKAQRMFTVILEEKELFAESDILNLSGIPRYGTKWAGYNPNASEAEKKNDITVRNITIVRSERNRKLYTVTVSFSSTPMQQGGSAYSDPPWNRDALLSCNQYQRMEVTDTSKVNGLQEILDPPVKKFWYMPIISCTFAVIKKDFGTVQGQIFNLMGKRNSAAFTLHNYKIEKHCAVLLQSPTSMAIWEGEEYCTVTLNLLLDLKKEEKNGENRYMKHTILYCATSYNEKKEIDGEMKKVRMMIQLPNGDTIPTNVPEFIGEDGKRLVEGSDLTRKHYIEVPNYIEDTSFSPLEQMIKGRKKPVKTEA